MRFLNSGFFHKSIVPISLIDILKYFCEYFCFRRDIQENIFQMFYSNFNSFYEVEKSKTNTLIDLNKKYILLILNYIKKNHPLKIPNKIKIFNEAPENELITYEEFQNERKSQFEKDLIKKQEEFENSINVKPPPVPEFSEKYNDKPISEMNVLIKEITSKRNYDVEQINYNNYNNNNNNINQVNNWLKPQDTSIKLEKFNLPNILDENNEINFNKNNNVLQKNVTWGENKEISYHNDNILMNEEEEINIFNKLKKVDNNKISLTIQEKSNEERLLFLENEINHINIKLNKIIDLIKEK